MKVTSYGAAGVVTGSCHLVEADGYRLLLDCGMYQGPEEHRNDDPFGFEAASVDAVVVSHVHLDHVGRLPRLCRDGFDGPVYTTPQTAALLPLMLEDSYKVMREDRRRARRHGDRVRSLPWSRKDLDTLTGLLVEVGYYQLFDLGPLRAELKNAGHLPGSAFIEVSSKERRLTYSGDLGNQRKEVLPAPDFPAPADLVLCEATYGDRSHRAFQATLEEFAELARQTLSGGGKLLVPSFALERTQEILFHLRQFEEQGRVPVAPVFVDSPLAIRVTRAYESMSGAFGLEVRLAVEGGTDPFRTADLRLTEHVQESKKINDFDGAATIIAGSGMLSGGRILHHLRRHLGDARNALVIIGYQPRGGLGRALIDGVSPVRVYGRPVDVEAQVHTLGGFSGHADQDELLEWLEEQQAVRLVHGDPDSLEHLRGVLGARGQRATIAVHGETVAV